MSEFVMMHKISEQIRKIQRERRACVYAVIPKCDHVEEIGKTHAEELREQMRARQDEKKKNGGRDRGRGRDM